jgi:hypothetical protein
MAKKKRGKERRLREKPTAETVAYEDGEGNILRLRKSLSAATIAKIGEPPKGAAATIDDAWRRREEMLFERLVADWEIAGLPLTDQKMLVGRFRMATPDERSWIRETIAAHARAHIPGLEP